ncbi:MAG TPA: PP2C family serine/threonine-protein phosphatase [Anaerolineales bacterium]|jgi:hypothetical protein|nr:PP2C family serine/threonine-protein phosphatase [Anaerolineales bacterium]
MNQAAEPESDAFWRVVSASVAGTSHQKLDLPCQDAHAWRILPHGLIVISLADGAGTANRAADGATRAADCSIAVLAESLSQELPPNAASWQSLFTDAFSQAHQSLIDMAEAEGLPLKAFATTLACVAVAADWLAVGQIGDGVVVVGMEGGDLVLAARPQRGEYANETLFLTMGDSLEQMEVRVESRRVDHLIVMSDGLSRLALNLPLYKPHRAFFDPLLAFAAEAHDSALAAQQLVAFLSSERVCERTDDDKTLVVAVRISTGKPLQGSNSA